VARGQCWAIVHTETSRLPYGGHVSWFKKQAATAEAPEPPEAAASPSPQVEQLTASEIDWIRTTIAELAEADVRTDDIHDLGRYYDELLTAWLRVRDADRPGPEKVIDQIGLAFGQYLADQSDLVWVIAADQTGPLIALHRPQGAVLLHPTTMVAERWNARETGILPGLAHATLQMVQAQV
jgi:Domain of unknown function (DUF3806)